MEKGEALGTMNMIGFCFYLSIILPIDRRGRIMSDLRGSVWGFSENLFSGERCLKGPTIMEEG